jgi:hypothetical protein
VTLEEIAAEIRGAAANLPDRHSINDPFASVAAEIVHTVNASLDRWRTEARKHHEKRDPNVPLFNQRGFEDALERAAMKLRAEPNSRTPVAHLVWAGEYLQRAADALGRRSGGTEWGVA